MIRMSVVRVDDCVSGLLKNLVEAKGGYYLHHGGGGGTYLCVIQSLR
jgi:hypothetical protein